MAAACGENQFHHKVGGALCTLRRSGGSEVYHQLLATMDCMEMVIVTSNYWGAAHGADPGEVLEDAEGVDVADSREAVKYYRKAEQLGYLPAALKVRAMEKQLRKEYGV